MRLSALNNNQAGTPREGAFNVNGLRSTFNNFLIDGVDNNAYGTSNQGFSNQVMQPAPDAISEFKVVTNNMSAEYGRAAGATINVAYRSGGNQFHGNAWEFLRDTKMNAEGFFKPATGKPTLSRHQYGGTFGGPIVRNKAFFFGDFEGFRQDRKITSISSIPTPPQRQGILSVEVRDPRSGVVYPAGTRIPMTAFASKVLSQLPDTTSAGNTNNYTILQQFTNHTDKAGGKVDMRLNDRATVFGRFGWRDLNTVDQPPIPLPAGGGGNGTIYARTSSSRWAALTCPATRRSSKRGSAGRKQARARTLRHWVRRARSTSTASPGCRAIRASRADCRRRASRATRRSAARRRIRNGSIRPCSTRR